MERFNVTVRLISTELHAENQEEAQKKAEAEADKMACAENYSVVDIEVMPAN